MASSLALHTRRFGRIALAESLMLIVLLSSLLLSVSSQASKHGAVDLDANEFAEFEDFDDDDATVMQKKIHEQHERQHQPGQPPPAASTESEEIVDDDDDLDDVVEVVEDDYDEGVVEDDDEFAHLEDEEEFVNFPKDTVDGPVGSESRPNQPQQLKFADVPAHLRNNWTNYQVEMLMLVGLVIYLLNYIYGKTKNQALAYAWFETHKHILDEQFSIVGDDGTGSEPKCASLVKDTDASYSIWCSGRAGCLGMLIQIKLIKRQDLISLITQFVRPKYDHVAIRIELDANEMDTYVFCFGQKKTVHKLTKEMTDLAMFTTEKKSVDKMGLPVNYTLFSEMAEAVTAMLDPKVQTLIAKYEQNIEYIHVSDQYSGLKPQEGESNTKMPETSRVLVFGFNIPGKLSANEASVDSTRPLMALVFHLLEKARRFRLSREGKVKADKNRQSAQEAFLKTTHAHRQEQAQARREEKIRERKQRLLEEEDPEKQRRLEKVEQKRDAKRKAPRMKQLKVKSM